MKIDEIIFNFTSEIEKQYGCHNPAVKICLDHESFNTIMVAEAKSNKGLFRYMPADMSDLRICGVQIVARDRKTCD